MAQKKRTIFTYGALVMVNDMTIKELSFNFHLYVIK